MKHKTSIRPAPALPLAQADARPTRSPQRQTVAHGKTRSACRYGVRLMAAFSGLLLAGAVASAATPDLSGIWSSKWLDSSQGEHVLSEPVPSPAAIFDDEDSPPPGGEPRLREPYARAYADFKARKRVAAERGTPIADLRTRCLPVGMPAVMVPLFPIEILQTPKRIVILAEEYRQVRRIYLNEKMPPLDDIVPGYNGHSVGHWEGDTLVVETQGIREDVQFGDMPHSSNMKITERLRLTAPDTLENRIVIDDPLVLAEPYIFTHQYKKDPTVKIAESVCDNNRYRFDGADGVTFDTNPALPRTQ